MKNRLNLIRLQTSSKGHTYTNPRPGQYLSHAHSHITRAVAATDSCFALIGAHQRGETVGLMNGENPCLKKPLLPRWVQSSLSSASSTQHMCNLDPEFFCACRGERSRALGTLQQDCFWLVSAKNNKSVSDWSIQVCTRAFDRTAYLSCEWVFPIVKVNTTIRWATPTYSWFLRFQNNICTTWLGKITRVSNFELK